MNIKKTDKLNMLEELSNLPTGEYYINPIPQYISQFASRELVSDILDKKISPTEDPKWKEFGFKNIEEYEFWTQRLCGIICIKMIINTYSKSSETIAELTKKAINIGGYKVYDEFGNFIDKGWYYKPLIELINQYGFDGEIFPKLSEEDLCVNVLHNAFNIVSVNPSLIRFDKKKRLSKCGGHLVLVIGFRWSGRKCLGFIIHNPSGRQKSTQENAFIPIKQFRKAFASRGIVIKKG